MPAPCLMANLYALEPAALLVTVVPEAIYDLIPLILPFECFKARFMQQALVGLILLAPMTAATGVQVVNFRMAFFSDAVSHSAFAGVAFGLIFSVNPHWTMPVFGVLVGLGIIAVQRKKTFL